MKTGVLWLAAALGTALAACIPVEDDRILARDLAVAEPQFLAIAPDTPLGYAPAPGVRRVLLPGELARFAARFHLQPDPLREVCVERPMEELTRDRLLEALAAAAPGVTVDLADFSRYSVPKGEITFPLAGLSRPADPAQPALWKGAVKYGRNHGFAIWVRARLSIPIERVMAIRALPAGHAIQPDSVRVEKAAAFPFGRQPAAHVDEVTSRIPRRPIAAGDAIFAYLLDAPREVNAGDRVNVEVASGQAHVSLDGRAEGAGRRGDVISVRNPASGRMFRATVERAGTVAVRLNPPATGEK
ncbi:MAG TPA: flagellar basal body P-ring formation chaperone FlgA [Bryobacteraceae bacterium]|nr:flagellar basal body P-ring formation chaperone FlgA [Bryobacteraceae bacterium]